MQTVFVYKALALRALTAAGGTEDNNIEHFVCVIINLLLLGGHSHACVFST